MASEGEEHMSPICWARVDDRLIHGQVAVAWRQHLGYEEIWIVDDGVAADPLLQEALSLATPSNLPVRAYSLEQASEALQVPPSQRVLLLFRRLQTALALVERGVPLAQLNIGSLAPNPGSVRVFKSISLNAQQAAVLDALAAHGVCITFQLTPNDMQIDWQALRRRHFRSLYGD
jgi:mannose/fructose/N-acetylgalactosamine-specific phosphotransferase system component IIB